MTIEHAQQMLVNSGWAPGRRVNVDRELAMFKEAGYRTWPALTEFLREFDGIRVEHMVHGRRDAVCFDARRAAKVVAKAWVDDYSQRVSVSMVPVGFAYHD